MEAKTNIDLSSQGIAALQDELEEVMGFLKQVLIEQGQDNLANSVPWSTRNPDTPEPDHAELVRLYSLAFQLLNLVEERVAMRTSRERENQSGVAAERGLWGSTLSKLKDDGFSPEDIAKAMQSVEVEPVFTAHPTESKRPSMRERQLSVYQLLVKLEHPLYTDLERRLLHDRLKAELQGMWMTGELHLEAPTVERELRNALFYLRRSLPEAADRIRRHLHAVWGELGFDPALLDATSGPRLRFGLWVGGDRDGHPFVTADVTRETLKELRKQSVKLHRSGLEKTARALSIASVLGNEDGKQPGDFLQNDLDALVTSLGDEGTSILDRNPGEPYRAYTYALRAALAGGQLNSADYKSHLEKLDSAIRSAGGILVANEHVTPLLHMFEQFGMFLASLDIRQNSAFHDRAAAQLLTAAGIEDGEDYPNWSEDRRREFLTAELESPRPLLHESVRIGDEADAVRDCFRVLADHYRTRGRRGLGSLIVSMTRDVSDLLIIHLFAREAGLCVPGESLPTCPLPVVPLLETLDDLSRGADIVGAYLDHPAVARALKAGIKDGPSDTPEQEIMLGYSDSCKDGGILASRVGLREAEHRIAVAGRERGVIIGYFHGRGGSVSRGAGPMHAFVRSIPLSAAGGKFRMTEQGETIAQKYSNLAGATNNLEIMLAAVTDSHVRGAKPGAASEFDENFSDTLRFLSDSSQTAYRELLEADGFIAYFREATPIDVLEHISIGSRPSRRTGTASLDDLRAIPWVFSWTQARFYLTGWYGVGSALAKLELEQPEAHSKLREQGSNNAFVKSLLYGVESSLASARPDLMERYSALVTDEALRTRFHNRIEAERQKTTDQLVKLLNGTLEERRPRFAATLALREDPLSELHELQLKLIRDWRASGAPLPAPLRLTVSAIASGLRSTG